MMHWMKAAASYLKGLKVSCWISTKVPIHLLPLLTQLPAVLQLVQVSVRQRLLMLSVYVKLTPPVLGMGRSQPNCMMKLAIGFVKLAVSTARLLEDRAVLAGLTASLSAMPAVSAV